MIARHIKRCGGMIVVASLATVPICAQDYDDPSGEPLYVSADARLVGLDGERSWLDGGFGKTRFGSDGGTSIGPRLVETSLVWKPKLGWSVDATAAIVAQRGQQHAVDVSEAFLSWRRGPHGPLRASARAGLFWPPVSMEHGGPDWAVRDTITPSAINSWIGEEVKVGGGEITASLPVAGRRAALTVGVFGFNDTSGTLLAFRGWALHDQKATAFGLQPLPTLDAFMAGGVQASRTRPIIELDNRPGYYAKLGWSPLAPVSIHYLYYDNRGDPQAVNAGRQWGWRTRFHSLGARLHPTPRLSLTSQAMTGSTLMGFKRAGRIWVDTSFRSIFVLATQSFGPSTVSGRIEAFGTRGRGSVTGAQDSEDGWSATLAGRLFVNDHVSLLAEALHVDSRRQSRARDGLDPRQRQTLLQLAVRVRN